MPTEIYKGRAFRDDSWDFLLGDFHGGNNAGLEELKSLLNDKALSVKDTELTYRLINHWSEAGLIPDNRKIEGKGWRKLSRLDVIWTHCLSEMRKFGLPHSSLKMAYKTTFFHHGDASKPIPLLGFGVALCLLKNPVFLIVFSDGWVELLRKRDVEYSKLCGLLRDSYLIINLNRICEAVLGGRGKEEFECAIELDKISTTVLSLISEGKLDSLEIKFKDGKPQSLKKVMRVNPSINLEGILKSIQHGELTIKRQNGKNVIVERSFSERLKS